MAVRIERPPNFELILAAFSNADGPGVIFAYGDDIYWPGGAEGQTLHPALLLHEAVHQNRQRQTTPDKWWAQYVRDAEFRYREELPAHVAEYNAQKPRGMDRNDQSKLLMATAKRLIAPLYDYQPPRTLAQAMRDLRWEVEQ
jgi:hypothetical protein